MEQQEKWEAFMATGKIDDYLCYKTQSGRTVQGEYASRTYNGDGNGAYGVAYYGMRPSNRTSDERAR